MDLQGLVRIAALDCTFGTTRAHCDTHVRRNANMDAVMTMDQEFGNEANRPAEFVRTIERVDTHVNLLADRQASLAAHNGVVGRSEMWQRALSRALRVASTDATVFLQGESGTGKEVVAQFIHQASPRRNGPFVAINCAALPEQLLESELFGYERGAFTGAHQAKPGQIELASRGELFLDEVSEISRAAQAKFLRFLEEREFQRLGGTRTLKANIRVVAATNRDLRNAVERGTFREDLFYRLQVFDIPIPPLRERPEDVLPLSHMFLDEIARSFGRPPAGLSEDARAAVLGYRWPGNVRELRNVLERAAILCEGGLIEAEHLGLQLAAGHSAAAATNPTDLANLECRTIANTLRECHWNQAKAAKRLGVTRTRLYHRIKKYRLTRSAVACSLAPTH